MNLKLGKSFPVLKFRPNIFEPLNFSNFNNSYLTFNINNEILTFNDLIKLDFILGHTVAEIKCLIQQYVQYVAQANASKMLQIRKTLKSQLKIMIEIIDKLEFENIQKDISELFIGNNGLLILFQYTWSPDILSLIYRIKEAFQLSKASKQIGIELMIYTKSSQKFYDAIQQVMHRQAKFILQQFTKQLYFIPQNWHRKLAKQSNLPEKIIFIVNSEDNWEQKYKNLLKIYFNAASNQQMGLYKSSLTGLLYLEIQQNLYSYINFLKTILLNKLNGIFSGDYETWGQIYQVCLKIYCRKENVRGKKGIQIDQIIQQQFEDPQFTNFLLKSNLQTVSLQSINFYYKNCPKSVRNNLKQVVLKKIKTIVQHYDFQQFEDIKEYLQTQASPGQKKQILQLIKILLQSLLNNKIIKDEYYKIQKTIPNLLEFIIKNPVYFYQIITQNLLNQMLFVLQNASIHKQEENKHKLTVLFIYQFVNTLLIQSYEEQFDFNRNSSQFKIFSTLIKQILLQFNSIYGLQVHEDGISIVSQWVKQNKNKNKNKSDSSEQDSEEQEEEGIQQQTDFFEAQFSDQITNLMLISGRDCDFKLQKSFNTTTKKQIISNQITTKFKILSDSLFKQRQQLQKVIETKTLKKAQQKKYLQSCLAIKGFKDKLLNQNIMSLALKIHPTINFSQITTFAVQFLTIFTPIMIDDPLQLGSQRQCLNIQPFDICDIISGEQPIQSMKLIYKKMTQFEQSMFDFQCLRKLPLPFLKYVVNCDISHRELIKNFIRSQEEFSLYTLQRFQQFRKFLFYCELMNKIFNKLNQKSQKGIKQIKTIYTGMQKICFKIWQDIKDRIISSQIYSFCQQNQIFTQMIGKMKGYSEFQLKNHALQFFQTNFKKMIKNVKLPYIDSIISKNNYITKTCYQLICGIGKVLNPTTSALQQQKLFNPLIIIKIQELPKISNISTNFKQNYQFLGQIIRFLAMIQFTCCNEQLQYAKDKQQHKQWSSKWRKNCKQLAQDLLSKITTKYPSSIQNQNKNLQINVFLVHLKAQIIKILIPILVKDPLRNSLQNPKTYNSQLQQTFCIFSTLCKLIQKISPGEQQHLMTFLQIFETFQNNTNKNTQTNTKISQFLYQAIQCLLELAFKGIRVRSYHFYKFIKSYLKLCKEKEYFMFFNSVIGFYVQNLMRQIVGQFRLPQAILNLCDQNMNNTFKTRQNLLKQKINQQILINQTHLKKSYNKTKYTKFIRFQPQFNCMAEKICLISMFINLFCRLNFKSLTQGIQKIWETNQMHIIYMIYLQHIVEQVSKQFSRADQKLLDIINVDCFGNLSIILRNCFNNSTSRQIKQTQYIHKLIQKILTLIQKVVQYKAYTKIKNSLTIPVRKIMQLIKSTQTSIQTIDYISQTIQDLNISKQSQLYQQKQLKQQQKIKTGQINNENLNQGSASAQILDMILTCYNIKLTKGINSNVHFNNLLYVSWDSDLKTRIMQNNMVWMQKRMGRKVVKQLMCKYVKKQQKQVKSRLKRTSIKHSQPIKQKLQFPTEIYINISHHSEQLFLKVIQNFVDSFLQFTKRQQFNKKDDKQACKQQQKIHETTVHKTTNLFSNLKILSLVTINNPQIMPYLLNHKTTSQKITVYDTILKSAACSLPIFAQLFMMFMKTNCGFCTLLNKNKQKQVLPMNVCIQYRIKNDVLNILSQQLGTNQKYGYEQVENLLKSINLLTKLSTSSSKPYFRSYKFGSINNKYYWQYRTQFQQQYFINLVQILKRAINKLDCNNNIVCIKLLLVYEQALNKVLKVADLAWMKLHLDIQLSKNNTTSSQKCLQMEQKKPKYQNNKLKIQAQPKTIPLKINYQPSQSTNQTNSMQRYDFEVEILDQQIYSIMSEQQKHSYNQGNKRIMQLMIQYSGKHSVWDDIYQSQDVLSYNRAASFANTYSETSTPVPNLHEIQNNHTTIQPIPHHLISQSQPNLHQQAHMIPSSISQQQLIEQQHQQSQQQSQQVNLYQTPKRLKPQQSIQQYMLDSANKSEINEKQQQYDGIVQDQENDNDQIVQNQMHNVDNIKQCMSQTSLQFLSQHSVKLIMEEQSQYKRQSNLDYRQIGKYQLLQLYEQSTINPQGRKQLLNAITYASVIQLQKFIANQAVDEQIQMLVVRQLWGRGIAPSTTSICKNSRYYGNMVNGFSTGIDLIANNKLGKCINSYINQATNYKRMYQQYTNRLINKDITLTQKYIPSISKSTLQHIILTYFNSINCQQNSTSPSIGLWRILKKLALNCANMCKIIQLCLQYINMTDCQIQDMITNYNKNNGSIRVSGKFVKLAIINGIMAGCVQDRIGIRLLFLGNWDYQSKKVVFCQSQSKQSVTQIKILAPILQVILKQSHLLNQAIQSSTSTHQPADPYKSNSSNFIHILWQYFCNCDQYKAHSKLQNNNKLQNSTYPYYQIQQSIKISQNIIRKIIDKIFACKTTIGYMSKDKNKKNGQERNIQELQAKQQLFMILFYIDPHCFETYYKLLVQKIHPKLQKIINKQYKILTNFQTTTQQSQQPYSGMQKQQKYWNIRQSKKITDQCQQQLQHFRNILVDLSINILPKYKRIRFNYHYGQNYRQWKLEIEILKQKLLTYGSIEGLVQLQQKQKQLQEWRRIQNNQIINQQILPIIQKNSQEFLQIFRQAAEFISQFLYTFAIKQQKQKIVIYNTCAKIYQILLATQILTHQQKQTYHSMSKLKTIQSIQSCNNIYGINYNRKRSRIQTNQTNRTSARLSINSCVPKIPNLLKKIGPSCTFLNVYIGPQDRIRQLHAKYSDVNKRLKILWGLQCQNRHQNGDPNREKVIECRRNHIIQDTLSQIDEDFVNLPIKIKFQGQIGIDYGGVTREWITLFMKQIISPELGLFCLSANKLTFQPNKNSFLIPNHLRYFKKIGMIVGKALKQNWLLQINLTKSFLKHILGSTLYIQDLQDIDPETAKSLKWILQNDIGYEDSLGLNFTYQTNSINKKQIIQLIPNGANTIVTQQNKKRYVKIMANMKMTQEIREQSKSFMSGLQSVIPYSTLSLFSYKEISLYLSGMPTIDIKQMQQTAKYQNFTPQCQQIVWFWIIISEWSQEQLANFLFFLTGSFKVPYGGFKQHSIGFNKMPSCIDYLPVAHTCFSVVDLSTYSSKQKMAKLLIKSIKQGKGFSVS